MTVLVTGGTGFIGRRLLVRLAADGVPVRATRRSTPGASHPNVEWVGPVELDDEAQLERLVDGVDSVVHLAGLAHLIGRAGPDKADEFHRVNAKATSMIAQACKRHAVRRLVFVSSIAIFDTASVARIDDGVRPSPSTDYGRSKLAGENAVRDILSASTTDWCIVRPPLVYGPGNPGNMARLLRLVQSGLPLPLGSIDNRRSFVFVDNFVDALCAALRFPGRIEGAFGISDGTDLSTPQLIQELAKHCGKRARLANIPKGLLLALARVGDVAGAVFRRSIPFDSSSMTKLIESCVVDGSAFRNKFGWVPPVAPFDGLAQTCRSIVDSNSQQGPRAPGSRVESADR